MKLDQLERLNRLSRNLEEELILFNRLDSMLKKDSAWDNQCKIEIGGDRYGNGRFCTISVPLQSCKTAVDHIAKKRDEAWSKVVSIRMEMRNMGVEP